MDTRKLLSFVTVAELNSFVRASEKLHFSQPALSKHVASLERELGVRLLERDSHSVKLTAAGRALQEGATNILSTLKQLRDSVINIGRREGSMLTVGMSVFHMNSLHAFHWSFREKSPQFTAEMNYELTDSIQKLLNGELDVLLIRSFEVPLGLLENGSISSKHIYRSHLRFCVHKNHPLAYLDSPQLEDLNGYDLISLEHILNLNGNLQRKVAMQCNLTIPEHLPQTHEEFMHMLFNDKNVGLYEEKTVQPPGGAYKLFDIPGIDLSFYITAICCKDNDNPLVKTYVDSIKQFIENYDD